MGLLRFLLAYSVLASHVPGIPSTALWAIGPAEAVESFFVISGFYMALILERTYRKTGEFYLNRFLRIYPLYWLVAGATLIYWFISGYWGQLQQIPDVLAAWFVFVNIAIFGQDLSYFLQFTALDGWGLGSFRDSEIPAYEFMLVPQAWTLGLELTFYLMAPWLFRRSTRILVLLFALLVGVRVVLEFVFGPLDDPLGSRFFPLELMLFVGGMLLYRIYEALGLARIRTSGIRVWLTSIAILCFFVLIGVLRGYGLTNPVTAFMTNRWTIVVVIALAVPAVFAITRKSAVDRRIGELSYPIYLNHILIIAVLSNFMIGQGIEPGATPWLWFLTTIFSILFAWLLVLVTNPIDRIRARVRARAR